MTFKVDGANGLTFPNSSTQTIAGLTTLNPQSGGVIQTVYATVTGDTATTSTTAVSTGLYATITPKFVSSKILVSFSSSCTLVGNSPANGIRINVYRGTGGAGSGSSIGGNPYYFQNPGTGSNNFYAITAGSFIDSPASTSALTYTVFHNSSGGQNVGFAWGYGSGELGSLILQEIAA